LSNPPCPLGIKTYQVVVLSKTNKVRIEPGDGDTNNGSEARSPKKRKTKEWSEPAAEERKDGDERHSLKRSRFFTSPSEGQEERRQKNGLRTR
jgi:hypothetical protein